MHPTFLLKPWGLIAAILVASPEFPSAPKAQTRLDARVAHPVVVLSVQGTVEVLREGARTWDFASTVTNKNILHSGDQLRTGPNSLATVRLSDLTVQRIGPDGHLRVLSDLRRGAGLGLLRGIFYFFHRDRPGQVHLQSPTVSAVVRGTEFTLAVEENGTTTLSLFDGAVEMTNEFGQLEVKSGQVAEAEPGKAPVARTPMIAAVNIIQWCLYYPAVLNLREIDLPADAQQALTDSLAAYRSGDLLAALAQYPAGRQPPSDQEKIYLAALLLSVGQVEKTEAMLKPLLPTSTRSGRLSDLTAALRKLIAAVKFQMDSTPLNPQLATCLLAESYYHQSQARLEEALEAARKVAELDPGFGFAQACVAEMEFSFGHTRAARAAVERSLQLAPRNAQALALKGFLLSAENRTAEAIALFEQAMAIDGALGHAWLGRGLCRIRRGKATEGLLDLEVAAALEPQRAVLRSYLGKAFSHAGHDARAAQELERAKSLDANDPTAWLYSALLNQQRYRINQAVRELETSQSLNDNRQVYRSRLLLDQDQAVRGANLANVYHEAGMTDVSVREAARAVSADYANFSAHLFLANSYDRLRDPKQINLRYETPWLSEYLLAHLLAPVGAGTLAQAVSQQEYSKLFERDRLGIASSTEYLSRGAWSQSGAQFGTFGPMSYALSAYYLSDNGQRPNNDLEQTTLSLQFKQQVGPRDDVYLQAIYYEAEAGDVAPYYNPADANRFLRAKERQEPLLLAGYHHEWAPGIHTLLLAGRLDAAAKATNAAQPVLVRINNSNGSVAFTDSISLGLNYRSTLEVYTTELQQIWQLADPGRDRGHTIIAGGRYQLGEFQTHDRLAAFSGPVSAPETFADVRSDFERLSFYGYDHWQVAEPLLLIGGVSYDRLRFPANFRSPPISSGKEEAEQVSPKAGFVLSPGKTTTLRGAYTRSLGGVSFDQSFQLEPSQVAGIQQSFRSLIPESVAGAIAGASFETFGLALDQKFRTGTYLGLSGELLTSDVGRRIGTMEGTFPVIPGPVVASPSSTRNHLDFRETSFTAALNQLVADDWSLGARYRISKAELEVRFPDLPASPISTPDTSAVLNQLNLYAIYHHPTGFFCQFESVCFSQSNHGYSPDLPGDDFWQFNAFAGYRFPRRHGEVRVGLLNITDQDYRLNPLNLTPELPRERTLALSLKLFF